MTEALEKTCTRCGLTKPIGEFHVLSTAVDGHRAACKDCRKTDAAKWYVANKELANQRSKSWRLKNPDKERERGQRWRDRPGNLERERQRAKKYRDENPEAVREWRRRAEAKSYEKPMGRIEAAIQSGVRRGIRHGSKASRSTFALLGYSPDDLKRHLEENFQPGMTWDNYGKWHIDHVTPLSAHNYQTPDDYDFKRAWALSNLQPLWGVENKSKGNRLTAPFQPSLLL